MQNHGILKMIMFAIIPVSFGMMAFPTAAMAQSIDRDVMLVNVRTAKCATIAGGISTDNNVDSVQFDCDSDPSRSWRLDSVGGNVFQIRNVQTNKCLTIAGGTVSDNNVRALQFDCDNDPSRTWRITDVVGNGEVQIRNAKTNKCLTIAGGTSPANNLQTVQFDCDDDPSRRWTIRLKL